MVLVLLTLFALFLLIPIVWLLLATTKSETGLVSQNPFSFGSLGSCGPTGTG